ncbi:MAG: DUF4091 domain-containing protein [Lentisphaerae bacterium]|nr:DUF4091 domain-containing protein [Lentisphaerota bacterium]
MRHRSIKCCAILLALWGILLSGAELRSGGLKIELRKNLTAPQKISYEKIELIQNFFYSWYARGSWYSDRSGVKTQFDKSGVGDIRIRKQNASTLEVDYECTDFKITSGYYLLTAPDALKIEFYLTARNDIYLGGIDPPGGTSLPLMRKNRALSHFYEVSPDLSLTLKSKGDYPGKLAGVVRNNCTGGFTDAKGENGYFILLDRRFYGSQRNTPVITGGGVCFSKEVCRLIRKGEVIKGQFYLVPFAKNASSVIKAAVEKFCDPVPERRWDFYEPYREISRKALKGFSIVADNEYFTAACGTTDNVLPQAPLPQTTVPEIKVAGAKNQNIFTQIVLKAKKDLKDLKFSIDLPGIKELRIERITPAPSDYPGTAFAAAGDFPDILQKSDTPELTPAEGNASYLLTITIPENASSGEKNGEIKIFSGKKLLAALDIKVTVHDFSLPKRSSFRSAFLAWTSKDYRKGFNADHILKDQRKLRITTPMEIYTPCDSKGNLRNPEVFRRTVRNALAAGDTGFRMSSVYMWRNMPHKNKTGKEAELYIKNFTRQVYAILKELNAVQDVWFLMCDETHKPENNLKHIKWCQWVKEAAPDLPIFSTQNHPEYSIAKQADILCGPLSSVDVLRDRFKETKEYWIYENGFPFTLGQPATVARTMPLRSMRHNVKGYHQWSSCHWPAEKNGKFRPGHFHGTASLYYPPEFGYRKNQPVRSMRLINCAQGIIDHDHITLLQQLIARNPGKPEAVESQKFLDTHFKALIPDVYTFNGSSADYDAFRAGIADRISKLSKIL